MKYTRIVVVDHRPAEPMDFARGRLVDIRDPMATFKLEEQDEGRTLKVFIDKPLA